MYVKCMYLFIYIKRKTIVFVIKKKIDKQTKYSNTNHNQFKQTKKYKYNTKKINVTINV